MISVVLGPVDIRFREEDFHWVDEGLEVEVKVNDEWISVAGCGMLKADMLKEAGHNPEQVRGYAFGVGLERLAALKLGLKSVQELLRPPYVQPGV